MHWTTAMIAVRARISAHLPRQNSFNIDCLSDAQVSKPQCSGKQRAYLKSSNRAITAADIPQEMADATGLGGQLPVGTQPEMQPQVPGGMQVSLPVVYKAARSYICSAHLSPHSAASPALWLVGGPTVRSVVLACPATQIYSQCSSVSRSFTR